MALCSGVQQAAGESGGFALTGQRRCVAEAEFNRCSDLIVFGLLRQHHDFHAVREFGALHARFDIGRRGIENLGVRNRNRALVVLKQILEIRRGWDHRAIRSRVGNVIAHSEVGILEISFCHANHILWADILEPVMLQKHQAPVAVRHRRAEGAGVDGLRIRKYVFEVAQEAGGDAIGFLFGRRVFDDVLKRRKQGFLNVVR